MEKVITEEKTITHNRHLFYCDECGAFLGESEEYKDGYYKKIDICEWKYCGGIYGWQYKRGNYCPECGKKIETKIVETLQKLGFRHERC